MDKEESNQEEKNMHALAKDQGNKGLSLSSKKLKEITIRPNFSLGEIFWSDVEYEDVLGKSKTRPVIIVTGK